MSAEAARVFAALGDPTRLALLTAVRDGGRSVTDLAEGLPMSRQAVTKHLRQLEAAGLLRSTRAGRETLFTGEPEALDAARARLDRIAAGWDAALQRLQKHVEGP